MIGESAVKQETSPGCGACRQKGSGSMPGFNPKIPARKRQDKGRRNRFERDLCIAL